MLKIKFQKIGFYLKFGDGHFVQNLINFNQFNKNYIGLWIKHKLGLVMLHHLSESEMQQLSNCNVSTGTDFDVAIPQLSKYVDVRKKHYYTICFVVSIDTK